MRRVQHEQRYFRGKRDGIEICRVTDDPDERDEADLPTTATRTLIVHSPSSRVYLGFAVAFFPASGSPQPDSFTGSSWGPIVPWIKDPLCGYAQLHNIVDLADADDIALPNSREVNSAAKKYTITCTLAVPTNGGNPVAGTWRLVYNAEPNQQFRGSDEEWDRIANEIFVDVLPGDALIGPCVAAELTVDPADDTNFDNCGPLAVLEVDFNFTKEVTVTAFSISNVTLADFDSEGALSPAVGTPASSYTFGPVTRTTGPGPALDHVVSITWEDCEGEHTEEFTYHTECPV